MSELNKTLVFSGGAVVLLLLAIVTQPKAAAPEEFSDVGEIFFPDFTDPNTATSLEAIRYDVETGSPFAFKVANNNGIWTIPSHNNYPADGKDRLAQTAAGLIGLTRDDFRTDNPIDYDKLGVYDPLDETAPSEGRGQRITIRGEGDKVLADLIVGNKVEGREDMFFVRLPEQKRVYAVKMNLELSTNFADWIETDLLLLDKAKVNRITVDDYSINELTGTIEPGQAFRIARDGSSWKMEGMPAGRELNTSKIDNMLKTLDELKIVGVRKKPEGLTAGLENFGESAIQLDASAQRSLQDKGFYISGSGQLVSNEGEMQLKTEEGVSYTLRFGEVAYGSGLELTAGGEQTDAAGPAENRYLFVTAEFDPSFFPEPAQPANLDYQNKPDSLRTEADRQNQQMQIAYEDWQRKIQQGRERTRELNRRFAQWYYVIPAASFDALDINRSDLLKDPAS